MSQILYDSNIAIDLSDFEKAQYREKYRNDQDVLNLLKVIENCNETLSLLRSSTDWDEFKELCDVD